MKEQKIISLINNRIQELDDEWNCKLDSYTQLPDKSDADILRFKVFEGEIQTRQDELVQLLKQITC